MSLPPQIIRVKRKRVEEAPVTFLQLDDENKRHRAGSNWVYQRRHSTAQSQQLPNFRHDAKPVIHVSEPQEAEASTRSDVKPQIEAPTSPSKRPLDPKNEPRRFHVSRTMLSAANESVFKGGRRGPALFVERSRRKKLMAKTRRSLGGPSLKTEVQDDTPTIGLRVEQKDLKKPGLANRARSRENMGDGQNRNPLPPSLMNRQNEDMSRIASDMNEWVLREVGANLESIEEEKKKQAKPRFKPKAPEKRYQERHPTTAPDADVDMSNAPGSEGSDEEGDDDEWVIEEYVRIPANTMKDDVLPSEVGFLVLEGEQESLLFYGHPNDEDDDLDEDEEDENAENHYTADYPEEEAESDDELRAYWNRDRTASDEEEFDQNEYDDDDEIAMEGDDDDARMARIVDRIKRHRIASERYP